MTERPTPPSSDEPIAPVDDVQDAGADAGDEAVVDHAQRLHTPAADEIQLTVRAIIVGCTVGGLVGAMNIYFGLKTGWSIGGSLIAAILGFTIFNLIEGAVGGRKSSPLEINITQTAGSAAGSMASAAGLLSSIPALLLIRTEALWPAAENADGAEPFVAAEHLASQLSYWEMSAWAMSIAFLGVFFAVPLRNQVVVVEKLRFPTGTAAAETIMSLFAEGAKAVAQARVLLYWGIGAGLFTIAAYFIQPLESPPFALGIVDQDTDLTVRGPLLSFLGSLEDLGAPGVSLLDGARLWLWAWGLRLAVSPLMFGAGMLIGPRVGISLLIGSVVGWGILAPWVQVQGGGETEAWAPGAIMSYQDGPRGWILWPGVAMMIADALTNLALSWKTVLRTFKPPSAAATVADPLDMEPPEQQVPNLWWMGGIAAGTVLAMVVAEWVFDIPWWMTLIAVAMSSILAMIATRSLGETDINPVGGMGKVTQLVFGGVHPADAAAPLAGQTTNLMCAGITGAGASQAGDMMQDLKTGWMLRASPRRQIIAQVCGIFAGVIVVVPIFRLFLWAGKQDPDFALGGSDLPAPAAQSWKAMAEVLSKGFDAMPPNAIWGVIGGAAVGVLIPVIRALFPSKKGYVPSAMAIGISFIVPAYYGISMFLGSMALVLWKRIGPVTFAAFWVAVASGLVAGEGLMGIVKAVFAGFGVESWVSPDMPRLG